MSTKKKFLYTSLSILLVLVLSDTSYRFFLAMQKRPASPQAIRDRIEANFREAWKLPSDETGATTPSSPASTSLHPFFGFEDKFDLHGTLRYFRRRPVDQNDFVVLVLGGSVGAIWYNHMRNFVSAALRTQVPEIDKVTILSYAHAGYKQPQQLNVFAYLLSLGYKPDLVINIDGFNEVAIGANNAKQGIIPTYPAFFLWGPLHEQFQTRDALRIKHDAEEHKNRAMSLARLGLSYGLNYSAILGTALEKAVARLRLKFANAYEKFVAESLGDKRSPAIGPSYRHGLESGIKVSVDSWWRSSVAIKGLCEKWEVQYLHVLQPTLHDKGSKPLTESERRTSTMPSSWITGVRIGYPLLRRERSRLEKHNITFLDLSRVFEDVSDTLYYDCCHFSKTGCEIMATEIIDAVVSLITP